MYISIYIYIFYIFNVPFLLRSLQAPKRAFRNAGGEGG